MKTFRHEPDPMLRRFERNLVVACAVMAAGCLLAGGLAVAVGVVAGTLLMAIGYGGIKAAVDVLTRAVGEPDDSPRPWRRRAWMLAKFAFRYALLAFAAYVMLVRLRVHPLGVMLGASAPVISAAIEGVSIARRGVGPGRVR